MMDRFEDLGIAPALLKGVEAVGWTAPAGIQADALPVIRRGNNVVLHASPGTGATGAWALGVLDRLVGEGAASGPRVLVLAGDPEDAARVAESVARLAYPAGLTVGSEGPGWADRDVDVLVLTPAGAAAAVRASALKLEGLLALVVRGLDAIAGSGQREDLETLVDITPGEAQRVAVTGRFTDPVDSFIERHVRRSMTIPARPGDDTGRSPSTRVRYRVVPEHEKAAAVVELMPAEAVEVAVICRTTARASAMETMLEARGAMGSGPPVHVLPREEADRRSTRAEVISADVPMDAAALEAVHARGGAVLVTARELGHLRRIAARAGVGLEPLPDPGPRPGAPERIRERIRTLLDGEDLTAELALIAPLLEELPAAEIAAAAMRLARERAGSETESAATSSSGDTDRTGAPPPSTAPTWTHLFVGIGKRDGVGPGDLVGAMTGEAGISGDQVGKIDVRESHTTVEVATPVARAVIEALNGRTLKGRSLRVDYDRKSRSTAPRPGGTKGGGRRGGGSGASRGSGRRG